MYPREYNFEEALQHRLKVEALLEKLDPIKFKVRVSILIRKDIERLLHMSGASFEEMKIFNKNDLIYIAQQLQQQ